MNCWACCLDTFHGISHSLKFIALDSKSPYVRCKCPTFVRNHCRKSREPVKVLALEEQGSGLQVSAIARGLVIERGNGMRVDASVRDHANHGTVLHLDAIVRVVGTGEVQN